MSPFYATFCQQHCLLTSRAFQNTHYHYAMYMRLQALLVVGVAISMGSEKIVPSRGYFSPARGGAPLLWELDPFASPKGPLLA